MSSNRFSAIRRSTEHAAVRLSLWLNGRIASWLKRRGPVQPPLVLGYRQIFILPTAFGWILAAITFAMLVSSLNFNNNMGLFTTFLVAGIALLSMHIAYRNLEGVLIRDCHAEQVFARQDLLLIFQLAETRQRHRSGIRLSCTKDPDTDVCNLEPAEQNEICLSIPTGQRGWQTTDRLKLSTRHPLGLFEAWSFFWPTTSFLVWPEPADDAPPLPYSDQQNVGEQAGDEGDEFHGLRDWRESDPIHRIAWKASQRHQTLLARQFTRPTSDQLILRLDSLPGFSRERRISILTRWLLDADQAGLSYGIDLGKIQIKPDFGLQHRTRCLNALAELP